MRSMMSKRGLACVLFGVWSAGLGAEEVGVLGPEGWAYETIFKQAGVPAIGIRLSDHLSAHEIIVVTPNAVRDGRALFAEHADRLKQYVQAGGFLLVLHQNDKGWDDRWLPYSCRNSKGAGQIEKIVQKDHPVFEGFEDRDLGSSGISAYDTFTDVAPEWKILCTDHYPDGKKPKRIALMECTYGKGRVLMSCYNSEISTDEMEASDIQKIRLLFNQLTYALARQGISAQPDLGPFQKMATATPVLAPAVKLANSRFFSMLIGHGKEMSTGAAVLPTGRLGTLLYHGAVYEATRRNEDKYLRQRYHLFREGFVIHWMQQGKKRTAGINGGKYGSRVYADIEIPSTLLDEHSCYTSLITPEKDVRIEAVLAVSADGKFIIREVSVANLGKQAMEKVEFHQLVNLTHMRHALDYGRGPISYDKQKDILLAAPRRKSENLPLIEEVCGLAGIKRSIAHSIYRGGANFSDRNGALITGQSNNADTGDQTGILVWPLGDLKPGTQGSTAAIIAIGDNRVDLDNELVQAKAFLSAAGPLRAKADRAALLREYAAMKWKQRTHLQYGELFDTRDPDGDGWDLAREKAAGTDPDKADTDDDGVRDPLDPNPTQAEPLIDEVTDDEIEKDRVIGLSRREIIRAVRGHWSWHEARGRRPLTEHLAVLRAARINCVAIRVGGTHSNTDGVWYGNGDTLGYKSTRYGDRDLLAEYIAALHRYDIDVRLEGLSGKYVGGRKAVTEWLDKPGGQASRLPAQWCCNSWVKGVVAAQIFDVARYPAEFICVNEERYFRYRADQRFKTPAGAASGACYCPLCVHRYKHEMGYELPGLRGEEVDDRKLFELGRWRTKCSTEAWQYWAYVARERNPEIKFMQQSVNEGGPYYRGGVGSDFTGGGLSGVDLGYKAGMAFGGDHHYYPYWFRMRKSVNHFVYAGAMKGAIASTPTRRGWVEHGGGFRAFWNPVWCYGSFISPIAQGGKAVEYFSLPDLTQAAMKSDPKWEELNGPKWAWKTSATDAFEYLKMAYVTLDKLNDWFFPAEPPKQIAFIWNQPSDEVYAVLKETWRYAISAPGVTRSTFMTYLFRTGYPFDVFYLHYADYAALKDYPVIVLPSPFCVAEDRVPMLEKLVRNGASLIILGEYGQLDCDGNLYDEPVLLDLAGIEQISLLDIRTGSLTTQGILNGIDLEGLKFDVREGVAPRQGTQALAMMDGEVKGIYMRELGKGRVIFMPGNFVANCVYPARTERPRRPTRTYDITKPGTKLMNAILDHCLGGNKAIVRYERIAPDANADIEIALLEKGEGDKVLSILNWEIDKKSVIEVGLKMPAGRYAIREWSMKPSDKARIEQMTVAPFEQNGKKDFSDQDLRNLLIELEPQQIRILNIVAQD